MNQATSPTSTEEIEVRAYHLWEAAGRPAGRHDEFWEQARREIAAEAEGAPKADSGSGSDGSDGNPAPDSAMPSADPPRQADARPASPVSPEEVTNVEQLRRVIDSGETRDKIAVTDPAAAPLGSDDEAGALHDAQGLAVARQNTRKR
jgi:hypothetical protein